MIKSKMKIKKKSQKKKKLSELKFRLLMARLFWLCQVLDQGNL